MKLGSVGWVSISDGMAIDLSQNREARTASSTPVDKLVNCWYIFGLVYFWTSTFYHKFYSLILLRVKLLMFLFLQAYWI